MAEKLPQISGLELIAKLKKLGWEEHRRVNHGVAMIKKQGDRTLITVIPKKRENLPKGTLMAILSQTGLKKSDIN